MRYKQRAFTLLEVLIALSLLAFIATSVTTIFGRGLERIVRTQSETEAYILAESEMDRILLTPFVADFPVEGDLMDGLYRYHLQVEPQLTEGVREGFNLLYLVLTISWSDADADSISIEALKLEQDSL